MINIEEDVCVCVCFILQVHNQTHAIQSQQKAKSYPLYKFIQYVLKLLRQHIKETDLGLHNVIVLCNNMHSPLYCTRDQLKERLNAGATSNGVSGPGTCE